MARMSTTDLERLEALLISLRDQVDTLSERVETRLHRLQAHVAELEMSVRTLSLDTLHANASAPLPR